ncbi:unnamed protein product [Scytosiphon promiscuus]
MAKDLAGGDGSDATDSEWLFDFLLSVFKSPAWDLAVMGFIDENCAVFDKEEENKLSYTTLHHQFKELVETLCANSLAEVGIAVGDFVEALEASRLSQDISTAVYHQLVALDDFVTFKKLMVKRNVELELEAVHALQKQGVPIRQGKDDGTSASDDEESTVGGDEMDPAAGSRDESKRNKVAARPARGRSALDRQLQRAMDANLQELELMHKREEVEQAELEQAIAMSLALEAKRVEHESLQEDGERCNTDIMIGSDRSGSNRTKLSQDGCKGGDLDDAGNLLNSGGGGNGGWFPQGRQRKEHAAREDSYAIDAPAEANRFTANCLKGPRHRRRPNSTQCNSFRPCLFSGASKALPPLSKALVAGEMVAPFRGGSGEGGEGGGRISLSSGMIRDPDVEAAERRREARLASEKAKRLLEERRQAQKALKAQSDVSDKESAQRERHLKDMRDRIGAPLLPSSMPLRSNKERGDNGTKFHVSGKSFDPSPVLCTESSGRRGVTKDEKSRGSDSGDAIVVNGDRVEEDFAEEQRRMMRVALTRHMKRELIETEQERLTQVQAGQLSDLNDKLRLVEKLRKDNSEREAEIATALRHQQRQRAQNVATSAATTRGDADEFTFGEVN